MMGNKNSNTIKRKSVKAEQEGGGGEAAEGRRTSSRREAEKLSRFSVRGGVLRSSEVSSVEVTREVFGGGKSDPFPWFHWAVWQQEWGPLQVTRVHLQVSK
jgi:hypothetical protein